MATTVWRGHLAFGLISIPIRLYKAARAEKVSFKLLHRAAPVVEEKPAEQKIVPLTRSAKAGPPPPPPPEPEIEGEEPPVQRVKRWAFGSEEDRPIPQQELVKGYEYGKDQYVVIEKEDLQSITPKTATEMQILEFVKLDEIDPIFFESSYYVAPDRAGEKAYALLFEALRKSEHVALAEVAMHNREHVMILRPGQRGLIAHTMFYTNEIRSNEEFRTDTSAVAQKELDLALMLIHSLEAKFEPEKFRDKYREKLEELIQAKIGGRKTVETAEVPKKAEVIDILSALQDSLKMVKKPATKEARAGGKVRRRG
jgi:DNA end-binding protein Ku